MSKFNIEIRTDCRQRFICSVKQRVCGETVGRFKPFTLEYAPKPFGNIEMRTVWGRKNRKSLRFSQMDLNPAIKIRSL